MSNIVASIDIGTSKVCIAIGEINNGRLQIIGLGKSSCEGVRKGVVVDIESTSKAILNAVEQAENMADIKIDSVYANIPGGYCNIINNKGIIAVSGDNREINIDDVKRVLNSASIISIPQDQQIIDIIPKQYIIDGYDEIKDPVGMVGVRLEAEVDIVTGSKTTVMNLIKTINNAGLEVLGIIMEPIAEAESVLTRDEKELGTLLIDIGAGTTDFSLFKNGHLVSSDLIPVAGNHITNDISIGFRITYDESEEVKKKFATAYRPLASDSKSIEVRAIGTNKKIRVTETQVAEIVEPRLKEIFEIIDKTLVDNNLKDQILAGIVLTGGGASYINGFKELGSMVFGLPIRLGQPSEIGVKEPIYSTVVGLINYSLKRKFDYYIEYNNLRSKKGTSKTRSKNNRNIKNFIKKIWNEYF